MDIAILSLLRSDARAWWYHQTLRNQGRIQEARTRERASIRRNVAFIRDTISNGGWMTIGRGGSTLHPDPSTEIQRIHGGFRLACIRAGIPTMDTTEMDIGDLVEILRGPMAHFGDSPFGSSPDGPLSFRRWSTVFDRYAKYPGAIFHNYTPGGEQC